MHTRIRRTLLILLAGALLVLGHAPAEAATGADGPAPATAPFTMTGDGFGHGHGMSQYGAKGAATAGLSTQQILAFYYPGTGLTSLASSIKVPLKSSLSSLRL